MSVLFVSDDVFNITELILFLGYCSVTIFILIMLFRVKENRYLKRFFFSFLVLCLVFLTPNIYPGAVVVKSSIFTTPFVFILLQRINFINDRERTFLCYIISLFLFFVLILKLSEYFSVSICKYIMTSIMLILNVFLVLYFLCKCNIRDVFMEIDSYKNIFYYVLFLITILVLFPYILLFTLFEEYSSHITFFSLIIFALFHIMFVYFECLGIFCDNDYAISRDEYDYYSGVLEDGDLSEETILLGKIIYAIENEKLYLNPNLTVADIALRVYTNRTYLSKSLNIRMSKNFSQFLNYYRVREACELFLEDPECNMSDVYNKCGFNTPASFASAFRYYTDYTPVEWAREIRYKFAHNERIDINSYMQRS